MIIERLSKYGAKKQTPDRIIIHSMGEFIEYNDEILHAVDFLNKVRLSAHILVCPNGDIIRCRRDDQGAYHALHNNKNSLGLEFLVEGAHDYASFKKVISRPYLTAAQYEAGMEFVRDEWWHKKGMGIIKRHSDVDPKRKIDPGEGFPWEQFLRQVGVKRV